jgi:toxin CcdB
MARFDIYPNPITPDRLDFPFVLEIQSDLLYRFSERVCVPLARAGAFPGMTERFNPSIDVGGEPEPCHMHPLGIAVFMTCELKQCVGNALPQALEIDRAMDMLLRGY